MSRIKIIVHETGERLPLLLDDLGLPLVEPNEYALTQRGKAWRTIQKKLYAISLFCEWLNVQNIDFHQRLMSGRLFSDAEINGSLFNFIRQSRKKSKVQKIVVSSHTFNTLITYLIDYLRWLIDCRLASMTQTEKLFEVLQEKKRILVRWFEKAKFSTSRAENEINKGLTEFHQKQLLEIVDPDSELNPWKSKEIRQRNYVVVLILINCGIRPAEILTLRVSDINIGPLSSIEVHRRPHDPLDPRKNSPEVKRSGRIISIDPWLARTIDKFIQDSRPVFNDRHKTGTDFLILSDSGNPLSYISLYGIFQDIRLAHPDLPSNFSPKTLRHAFSSNLEKTMRENGTEEIRRREILAFLRGDSSLSSQDIYIRESVKAEAREYLASHQKKVLGTA